jgi:flavin reductase (DIM6/NTAB) family NADH-FMN oxidoreductase RutF
MDADAKKTTLRMIPYGLYVLTADDGKGTVGAATVNWVTQTAFAPPMVVGVKADSGAYAELKAAGTFALNMLGKEHKNLAFAFFKPAKLENGMLSGQSFLRGAASGQPILDAAIGAVECKVKTIVEEGDHHIVVGEVVDAHLRNLPAGRPDAAILEMKDLGDNVFYGG